MNANICYGRRLMIVGVALCLIGVIAVDAVLLWSLSTIPACLVALFGCGVGWCGFLVLKAGLSDWIAEGTTFSTSLTRFGERFLRLTLTLLVLWALACWVVMAGHAPYLKRDLGLLFVVLAFVPLCWALLTDWSPLKR